MKQKIARRTVLLAIVVLNVMVLFFLAMGRPLPSISTDRWVALNPASPSIASARQEPTGTLLLVNDAATENPSLQPGPLVGADGSQDSSRMVNLPAGFSISVLATGLSSPRFMAFDSQGNLLVAAQSGSVYRHPAASDGSIPPAAEAPKPLIGGLNRPSSLAFQGGYLYVGETSQISRYPYDPRGDVGNAEVVIPDLPVGGHSTRTVEFAPDGSLFVSVGSSCNICVERDERRAAVIRYTPDGTNGQRFAWGLRNAVGLAFHPVTGTLWVTVNERDNQGNEVPPDLVTAVGPGEDFGWPACQPPDATPQSPDASCNGITPPTVGIQAHSAPLGLTFYTGSAFPSSFHGDLFVVQHGSWNRQPPAAPKILRIRFENGLPTAAEDFATGWQRRDGSRWGRPAGVIVAPDGSLIVSDDTEGVIYRITYTG